MENEPNLLKKATPGGFKPRDVLNCGDDAAAEEQCEVKQGSYIIVLQKPLKPVNSFKKTDSRLIISLKRRT